MAENQLSAVAEGPVLPGLGQVSLFVKASHSGGQLGSASYLTGMTLISWQ